jgi:glycosyltransferase involved in cell wall biosynthesis
MKVLMVHQLFGDRGGAESTLRRLTEGLVARDCEVSLLHGPRTGTGEERFRELYPRAFSWLRPDGIARALATEPDVLFVHKLDELPVLEELVKSGKHLVRMVHDHDIYCQRRHRYLPHNRSICTRRAGAMCGVYCGVLHEPEGFLPIRLARPSRKLREIELCQRFEHHITVSEFLRNELILHDFPPDKITPLWPAVREPAPGYLPRYSEPLVVYAGQIVRGKGVDVLIEALARLTTPGYRAVIVGDGSHSEYCAALIERLGLADRVQMTGFVPQHELHRLLEHARVAVVPSVWPEPLGAVGIEMMRHGLPVVGFDVGGISEWLSDGVNGFLVPVFDRAMLADRIDRLLADPELARSLGAQGRSQAEVWCDSSRYFDTVLGILEDAVKHPSGVSRARPETARAGA